MTKETMTIGELQKQSYDLKVQIGKALNDPQKRSELEKELGWTETRIARMTAPKPVPSTDDESTETDPPAVQASGEQGIDAEIKMLKKHRLFTPIRKINLGLKRMKLQGAIEI